MYHQNRQTGWYGFSGNYRGRAGTSRSVGRANVQIKNSPILIEEGSIPRYNGLLAKQSKRRVSEMIASGLPAGEKSRIVRNVIFISISFTVLYSAFRSMENLQTSINPEKGLGTQSLAAIYVSVLTSSLFLPSFFIRRLTVKWTMTLSMLCFSVYIATQFYPRFYTLLPAGIILGLGSAPMWIAQATYLTQVAHVYSALVQEKPEVVIMRFFGIFFLFFESSQVWGNVISSLVLSDTKYKTFAPNDPLLKNCGPSFCPGEDTEDRPEVYHTSLIPLPAAEDIYTLASIYLVCALSASVIIAINVDCLVKYGEKERGELLDNVKLFMATIMHMKHGYSLLLVPISVWYGFENGFFTADYTQAYVTCAYSIHYVGYVMMSSGVLASIFSMSLSPISDITGRVPILSFGAVLSLCLVFTLLYWQPTPAEAVLFFTISAGWGMADAVWQTQLFSLIGVLFPNQEEVAFSNFKLCEALGYTIAYASSPYICTTPELYIIASLLVIGMVGYYTIEIMEYRNAHSTKVAPDKEEEEEKKQEEEKSPEVIKAEGSEHGQERLSEITDKEPENQEKNNGKVTPTPSISTMSAKVSLPNLDRKLQIL